MFALPFKLHRDRRHHILEQKRKVVNWREYDESLRRRGSLTVWLSDREGEGGGESARARRAGDGVYRALDEAAIIEAGAQEMGWIPALHRDRWHRALRPGTHERCTPLKRHSAAKAPSRR